MSRVLRITDAASRRVTNPVFDNWTSGVPDNWTSTGTPTLAQIISEGTIQSYASAYAVDILNPSTQAVRGIYQDITDLVEGQTYYISVYVRPVVGTVRLYAWDGGGTSNAVFVESTSTTGEYQQLIVEKTATSGGIRIGLIAFNASSRAVFDLVQIATFNIEFIEGVYSTFFRVTNWDIAVPDYKGGGVFSSSPVAEGQKLIDGYWDNVTQTISFYLRGDADTDITTQNAAANKLGELFQALQAARDFSKTSWVRDPVYMQFKAENETNYRYAFIANARIPQLSDMYNIEFAQLVMKDLDLIIEHPVAFGMPPGEGAPVLSGVRTAYNSQNYGNYDESGVAEDTAEWVHFGNRNAVSNITNMHLGTGGANLIGGSLPRNVAANSTATYFGISSAVSGSGPFTIIVFHVSRAAAGAATGAWQYWNGSTWTALTALDTSSSFTILGWNSISFNRPAGWTAASPGGSLPSGLYIRFNVTGSYSTVPQIDREVFTVNKNYLEFPVSAVSGDVPTLFGMLARNVSVGGNTNGIDRMIGGLRSVDRGADFQSIINLGGAQNHASIAISGSGSSTASTLEDSTDTVRRISFAGDVTTTVTISGDLAIEYMGEFRCFAAIRKHQGLTLSAYLSYAPFSGAEFEENEAVEVGATASTYNVIYDLGLVNINLESNGGYLPDEVIFNLNMTISDTDNVDLHSLIFIPVDEYQFEATPPTRQEEDYSRFQAGDLDFLHFGSAQFYKSLTRTSFIITENDGNDKVQMKFFCKANGPSILQSQGSQRMYFIGLQNVASIGAAPEWGLQANIYVMTRPFINPRYLGMRGSN